MAQVLFGGCTAAAASLTSPRSAQSAVPRENRLMRLDNTFGSHSNHAVPAPVPQHCLGGHAQRRAGSARQADDSAEVMAVCDLVEAIFRAGSPNYEVVGPLLRSGWPANEVVGQPFRSGWAAYDGVGQSFRSV